MHQVKAFHRRLGGAGQPDRAGVVDQDIDAAEMFRRLCGGRHDLFLFADIHLQRQRLAAGSLDRSGGGMDGAGQFRIGHTTLGRDHDIRPVAGSAQRDRQSNAPRGTGDEQCLAGQIAHEHRLR